MQEIVAGRVFRKLRRHAFQECQIIHMSLQTGEQITDPVATLAVLPKLPGRLHDAADVIKLSRLKLPHRFPGILAVEFA